MRKTVLCVVSAILLSATMSGCNKGLFPENSPRSQYDRYDELRGRQTPRRLEVPFGQGSDKSALRERLEPLETRY